MGDELKGMSDDLIRQKVGEDLINLRVVERHLVEIDLQRERLIERFNADHRAEIETHTQEKTWLTQQIVSAWTYHEDVLAKPGTSKAVFSAGQLSARWSEKVAIENADKPKLIEHLRKIRKLRLFAKRGGWSLVAEKLKDPKLRSIVDKLPFVKIVRSRSLTIKFHELPVEISQDYSPHKVTLEAR